ncbi:hypothetical protein C9150_05055 [Escherichia coli]|nr:hypothetical protein C9156_06200 [Escherichia coli]TJH70218.1 hypothetical protein C9149_05065 [Escherichia coli]TJH82147.1 hypothetical protein C9150_05055 [Escherichia coli]TJQ62735.1 hypothetical protein C9Z56_06435 [Escherichia coli]
MALQITPQSKTAKLTTPLTTPFHEQYRTTTNKDQHALTVIIFRLSVMKLVDVPRYGDPHIGIRYLDFFPVNL